MDILTGSSITVLILVVVIILVVFAGAKMVLRDTTIRLSDLENTGGRCNRA